MFENIILLLIAILPIILAFAITYGIWLYTRQRLTLLAIIPIGMILYWVCAFLANITNSIFPLIPVLFLMQIRGGFRCPIGCGVASDGHCDCI